MARERFAKGIKFLRVGRKTTSTPVKSTILALNSAFQLACISYKFRKKIRSDWKHYLYINPETTVPLPVILTKCFTAVVMVKSSNRKKDNENNILSINPVLNKLPILKFLIKLSTDEFFSFDRDLYLNHTYKDQFINENLEFITRR